MAGLTIGTGRRYITRKLERALKQEELVDYAKELLVI